MKNILIILVALVILSGCTIDYTYEVSGTANYAVVTYTTEQGSISQETSVKLPWSKKMTGYVGDIVTVSAQNSGELGNITVEIYKEGDLFKRSESSGPYGIAATSGEL